MRRFSVLLAILMVAFLVATPGYAAQAKANTDTGYLGNDQWIIDSDGDLVPASDSSSDIGASGSEVDVIYTDEIYLGGTAKTSWGSVVSPMTDASGYVYPTDSGAVYRLYDAGYLSLGANTAGDWYIVLDSDTDDYYIGSDDTDNDFAIGIGTDVNVDHRISIVDAPTITHIVIGDNVDAEDKYLIFDGNLGDQYLGYLDTYDMLIAGDGSTMDSDMCFGVENAATPLLVLWNGIDGYGAVDIDYGSVDVTDHTFVTDGGTLILDGTITLTDAEVISNATDDTIRIASNDLDTILEVYTAYDTTGDATLKLSADLGDAAGEQWTITSTGATTDLVIGCDDSSSGTPITRFTISDAGVVTTVGTINLEIDNAANTSVTDVLNLQHFTSGTAAAGLGVGLTFDLENAIGTEEEHGSIDLVATTSTDGAEDTDLVVNLMSAGALAEVFRIVAASSGTVGDSVTITSNTTETNAVTDILSLANVTGTAAANTGLGITWDFEDASGAEEQASLDVVLIDETNATEDADFVFSQQSAGGIVETLRVWGTQSATAASGLQITGHTSETNGIVDVMKILVDSSGTPAANLGAGLSIQIDDETPGVEEQASLDWQVTDATTTAENCDWLFNTNVIGTIRNVMKIDTDCTATAGGTLEFTSWTIETNGVIDVLNLTLDNTADTGTNGLGAGISVLIEQDDSGTPIEQASIDFIIVDSSTGVEDCDVVFNRATGGTVREALRLVAQSAAATSDSLGFTAWTIETNGIVDILTLTLDNTADTATDDFGAGISILMEQADSATPIEQASLDFQMTDNSTGAEDCDFIVSQMLAGTLAETLRMEPDAGLTILGATPINFEGATADAYETILAVGNAASSDKTVTLPSITASIALETVATVAITADTTATITVAPGTDQLFTYTIDTDDENCTLTFSAGGTAGDIATIIFITDTGGSNDEVMTFDGTLSDSAGTLTLANGTAKRYVIVFISDGTIWNEISRTAVLG